MGELEIGSLLKCESLTCRVIYCTCSRISACAPVFIHLTVYTQLFMFPFVDVCNHHRYFFLHAPVLMEEVTEAEQQCVITQLRKRGDRGELCRASWLFLTLPGQRVNIGWLRCENCTASTYSQRWREKDGWGRPFYEKIGENQSVQMHFSQLDNSQLSCCRESHLRVHLTYSDEGRHLVADLSC